MPHTDLENRQILRVNTWITTNADTIALTPRIVASNDQIRTARLKIATSRNDMPALIPGARNPATCTIGSTLNRTAPWPRRLVGAVMVLLTVALLPMAAMAQSANETPRRDDIGDLQKRLEQGRKGLADIEARGQKLRADREAAIADREKLTARSMLLANQQQQTERRLSAIESTLDALEQRLTELTVKEQEIQASLESQKLKIAKLLAAMQRMGRNPPPVVITRRSDALSMVRSAMLLAHAFPELRKEADVLRGQLEERRKVREETERRRAEKLTAQEKLNQEKIRLDREGRELDDLLAQKRQLIAKFASDLNQIALEKQKQLSANKSLNDLIASLDKVVSDRTGLGPYNNRDKSKDAWQPETEPSSEPKQPPSGPSETPREPQVALRTPGPPGVIPPGSGISTRSGRPAAAPELSQPGATLVPTAGVLPRGAGRLKPAIPFARARGKLPLPTSGRMILGFQEKTRFNRTSKGVVFETRPNARITAPADGWVVYAGTFRTYGQLLILNAGDDYHIVMAGMSRIDVQLGQFVLASEPVGAMGSAPASDKRNSAPVLYVEFRQGGRPIDPSPWWAKKQVVAQR